MVGQYGRDDSEVLWVSACATDDERIDVRPCSRGCSRLRAEDFISMQWTLRQRADEHHAAPERGAAVVVDQRNGVPVNL